MNPLTNMKNQQKMNERELSLGLTGTQSSWHSQYDDSAWVFVGGLPFELTEGDVICIFSQCGEIVNVNLVRDKDTGKSKGFAFICYEDQRSTILAVDNMNGAKVLNRSIRVDHKHNYQVPKERGDEDELTKLLREKGCAPATVTRVQKDDDFELLDDSGGEGKTKKKKKKKDKKIKKEKKKLMREELASTASRTHSIGDDSDNDKYIKQEKRNSSPDIDIQTSKRSKYDKSYESDNRRGHVAQKVAPHSATVDDEVQHDRSEASSRRRLERDDTVDSTDDRGEASRRRLERDDTVEQRRDRGRRQKEDDSADRRHDRYEVSHRRLDQKDLVDRRNDRSEVPPRQQEQDYSADRRSDRGEASNRRLDQDDSVIRRPEANHSRKGQPEDRSKRRDADSDIGYEDIRIKKERKDEEPRVDHYISELHRANRTESKIIDNGGRRRGGDSSHRRKRSSSTDDSDLRGGHSNSKTFRSRDRS